MATATAAAAASIRRIIPRVTECFRNGILYQPDAANKVAENIRARKAFIIARPTADISRYNKYYRRSTAPTPALTDTSAATGTTHTQSIVAPTSTSPVGAESVDDQEHNTGSTVREDCVEQKYSVEEEVERRRRRLTVLFTWLGAKERYAHKYIDLWTARGHTVLHVTTSVRDLLMPRSGAEVTAARVMDHISELEGWRVIVHGLSVGGYITQKVLMANDNSVTSKLSHQIYDSFTNVEGLEGGVENAVHPRFKNIAKRAAQLYTKYADMSSFNESRNFILNCDAATPIFFMHSLADRVAQYTVTLPLIDALKSKTPVDTFLVPAEVKIPHVNMLRHMGPDTYMSTIETFLESYTDPVH